MWKVISTFFLIKIIPMIFHLNFFIFKNFFALKGIILLSGLIITIFLTFFVICVLEPIKQLLSTLTKCPIVAFIPKNE